MIIMLLVVSICAVWLDVGMGQFNYVCSWYESVDLVYLFSISLSFFILYFFFLKKKPADELRISDWSSDVCSSDLALQDERVLRVAQRLAGGGVLQAGNGDDLAGTRFLDVLTVIRVHLQHAPDALAVALHRVEDLGAGGDHAGIDAHEGQRADEGVGHDLESEGRGRRIVAGRTAHDFVGFRLQDRKSTRLNSSH